MGSTRIFLSTNCEVALFDRTHPIPSQAFVRTNLRNSVAAPNPPDGVFTATSPSPSEYRLFDPRVHYDPYSDRYWILASELEFHTNVFVRINYNFGRVHLAVSKTANPTSFDPSEWWRYVIDVRDQGHVTEPHLGFPDRGTINVNPDWLFLNFWDKMCAISPTTCESGGVPYQHESTQNTVVYFLPKQPLMDGTFQPGVSPPVFGMRLDDAGRTVLDTLAATFGTPDPAGVQYSIAVDRNPFIPPPGGEWFADALRVEAYHRENNQWVRATTAVPLPSHTHFWRSEGNIPEPVGNFAIIGSYFMQAVHRNGSLYGALHMRPKGENEPSPPSDRRTIVRWFQVQLNGWPQQASPGPQVVRVEDIDPDSKAEGENRAVDPSIAVNALGEVCVTFTVVGPNTYPQIWRAGYPASGGPNIHAILPSTCMPRSSLGIFFSQDFSAVEPDPLDPCIFYGHSMLAQQSSCGQSNVPWQGHLLRYCICTDLDVDFFTDAQYDEFDMLIYDMMFVTQHHDADFVRDGVIDILDRLAVRSTLRSRPRR